jgi:MFS-type transporter involved in bile tolerance (Atg22 family)
VDAPHAGSSMADALGNAFRLSSDRQRHGQEAFTASPFSRLLVTHVLSLAGDALVTLALAGSLFFSTPLHAARGRVALTLLLTMAPFAVVAPLLGPIIDRTQGGRRAMVVATAIGRALACLLMARYINSFLLFPAAFLTLVCSKGYTVAKATLVPSAVQRPQDLVEANSKLAVSGAIAGFAAAIPGVAILKLASAAWLLRVDVVVFVACAITAMRLQVTERRVALAANERGDTEVIVDEGEFPAARARVEVQAKPLPPGAIQVAAFAMGTLRLIVGFMTFLVAFGFRNDHAPAWWFGVVLAGSIGGNLVGAAVAPWLRSRLREELVLAGSALTVAAAGVLALLFDSAHSRPAATLLAGVIGLASGAAKLSFDALVQRHIPAASQGRAFGRFEAGFQLVWVLGGLLPVVIEMSLPAGFVIITLASVVAAVVYIVGTRMARLGQLPPWWPGVSPPSPGGRPRRSPRPPGAGGADAAPPVGATVPFATAPPAGATGATVPIVASSPAGTAVPTAPGPGQVAPFDGDSYDDMPWMNPPPDLGTYPPPIDVPPLGQAGRPVPPPLAGPPPRAAPLAPRSRPPGGSEADPDPDPESASDGPEA